MATYSRVGVGGWRQGDDATDQARVGLGGWYQVASAGGGAFLLEITPGSYALTGSSATTLAKRQSQTEAGSYALTGFSARTEADRRAEVTPGSYSLTGQSADLVEGLAVVTTPGSYSLIGSSATTLADLQVITTAGAYALTGQSAELIPDLANPVMETVPGVYSLIGEPADLTVFSGIIDTHDGFWAREYRKMWERKPKVSEVVELVKDEPIEALEVVREVVKQKYELPDNRAELSRFILQSVQLQRFIAKQLIVAAQKRAIDDEESDIEEILLMI